MYRSMLLWERKDTRTDGYHQSVKCEPQSRQVRYFC